MKTSHIMDRARGWPIHDLLSLALVYLNSIFSNHITKKYDFVGIEVTLLQVGK